jgi:hypothetical protein
LWAPQALGDVRRFDNQLVATKERIVDAVVASGTTGRRPLPMKG